MTQNAALIALFRSNGNRLTASQIWDNAKTVGRKYTGRISELRAMGYVVECIENKDDRKNNVYILTENARAGAVAGLSVATHSDNVRSSIPRRAPISGDAHGDAVDVVPVETRPINRNVVGAAFAKHPSPYTFPGVQTYWGEILQEAQRA